MSGQLQALAAFPTERIPESQNRSRHSGGEEKVFHPHRKSNPRNPIVQPIAKPNPTYPNMTFVDSDILESRNTISDKILKRTDKSEPSTPLAILTSASKLMFDVLHVK
jgi:hypothetical protein